jgi:hypothetical protein
MKRDMDLLRAMLLKIEEQPFGSFVTPEVPGYSDDELYYHAKLAEEAGFIIANFTMSGFTVQRLTYAGHEFLDAAREETLWKKAKQIVLNNSGTLTVEALKAALSTLMQQAARRI